jgi:hypothetical protein
MATIDRTDSCIIKWAPSEITIYDLEALSSYITGMHEQAVPLLESTQSGYVPISPPRVASISMRSPFSAEIVASLGDSTSGLLALGLLGYMLKHPEAIGGWLPRVGDAWYQQRTSALIAKAEYLNAKAELEIDGQPINTFETSLLPTLERSLNPPEAESEADFEAGL